MKDVYTHKGRILLAAAAVSIGSFVFVAPSFGADPAPAPADNPNAMDRDVDRPLDSSKDWKDSKDMNADKTQAPAASHIRDSLASTTEDACSKGGYNDLVKHFVDADRTRLQSFKPSDGFAKLDGRIDSFQKNWKAKYGQEFSYSKNANLVLTSTFARISQGEIGGSRTGDQYNQPGMTPDSTTPRSPGMNQDTGTPGSPRSSTPGAYDSKTNTGTPEPKVDAGTADDLKKSGAANTDANSGKVAGGDTNKEPGRNIATVVIQASADGKEPALNIPLVHEFPNAWKIDVPDSVDGQKLCDNLVNHLTMVDEDRANWPADVNEGYRTVTRHILSAIMDGSTMHASR